MTFHLHLKPIQWADYVFMAEENDYGQRGPFHFRLKKNRSGQRAEWFQRRRFPNYREPGVYDELAMILSQVPKAKFIDVPPIGEDIGHVRLVLPTRRDYVLFAMFGE